MYLARINVEPDEVLSELWRPDSCELYILHDLWGQAGCWAADASAASTRSVRGAAAVPVWSTPPAYYAPPPVKQNVSNLWYIAPVLFAILGGAIAWFLNKDKDPEKARNFLIVGAVMTAINVYLMYG